VKTLNADATDETTVTKIFQTSPDVLVLAGGAIPPASPIHQLDWETFSESWNTDVKIAFLLAKYALAAPVKSDATIIFI
jgi:NAD(P)-dependent dehydrogenase (short-subunit alcohol dehydrogenase family)